MYRYIVEKGVLYIQDIGRDKDLTRKRRVIVKEDEKQKILSMCHDGIDGMHFGRDKTYAKASDIATCVCTSIHYQSNYF